MPYERLRCVSAGLASLNAVCVADGSHQLIESNIVCDYLDKKYHSSGPKLFPDDPFKSAKARLMVCNLL